MGDSLLPTQKEHLPQTREHPSIPSHQRRARRRRNNRQTHILRPFPSTLVRMYGPQPQTTPIQSRRRHCPPHPHSRPRTRSWPLAQVEKSTEPTVANKPRDLHGRSYILQSRPWLWILWLPKYLHRSDLCCVAYHL